MRIYRDPFFGIGVEGSRDELIQAGVLHPEDDVPLRPRGCIERGNALCWTKITMGANGLLRVYGRRLEACRVDAAFQAFLARMIGRP